MSIRCDGGLFGAFVARGADAVVVGGLAAMRHRGLRTTLMGLDEGEPRRLSTEAAGQQRVQAAIGRVGEEGAHGGAIAHTAVGKVALLCTGNLVNAPSLEREILADGGVLRGASIEELLLHLIAQSPQRTLINRLVDALARARGGFALLLLSDDRLVALRDPLGLRQLFLGRKGRTVLLATESRAILAAGGSELREVEPGEMVILDREGPTSLHPFPRDEPQPCVRELVSVARTDSLVGDRPCHDIRRALGLHIARQQPAVADLVTSMGSASAPAAAGVAEALAVPFYPDVVVEPGASAPGGSRARRQPRVSVVASLVAGKRVLLIHDALGPEVPWSTVVQGVRDAGASEVHVRLTAPPVLFPCPYGVPLLPAGARTPVEKSPPQVQLEIGADSVDWTPLEALAEVLGGERFCAGCFCGTYPLVHEDLEQPQLSLFEGDSPA